MRHLGYALVAFVFSLSIADAQPKKKGPDPKAKTPAGQKQPNAPKPVDKKLADQLTKLDAEYSASTIKQTHFVTLKIAKQLYDVQVKATGIDSKEVERRRVTLASAYSAVSDHASAEKMWREHLAGAIKNYGVESREVLYAYQYLSGGLWAQQRYEELEAIQQHILAATKKFDGEKSVPYASALQTYGQILQQKNEWGAALRVFEEVLRIHESLGKPDDWSVISAIQMVANTYWAMNQQAKAIPLFDRAVSLATTSTGQMLTLRVSTIWTVALQYSTGGRKDLAAPLFKKAIDMTEAEITNLEKTKPDDWQLASLMGMVGSMHRWNADYAKAEDAYSRYMKWAEKKGTYSGMESALAEIKRIQGKNKEALALYEKARDGLVKIAPQSAYSFNFMMADVLREMGDYKRAIDLFEEYRKGLHKQLGKNYPGYSMSALSGVMIYASAGRFKESEAALAESLEASEKDLQTVLRVGTDTDHAIYFSKGGWVLDTPLNFNLNFQPKSGTAARLALTTVLRRKGRLLDAAAAALATIRSKLSVDDKKLLDELNSARAQLAKLTVAGPGATGDTAAFGKEIASLEDKILKLEAQVSKKSAAYRTVTQPITLAGVQKMILKDARLIELIDC